MSIHRRDPLHIRRKLLALALIVITGMVATVVFVFSSISTALYQDKKMDVLDLIDTGKGIAEYFHGLETDGKLTRQQAQRFAIHAIEATRFRNDGYLWIIDTKGNVVMHPMQPELDGKNALNLTDKKGDHIIRDFLRLANRGGGWLKYYWPRPSDPKHWYHKLSYIAPYEPWHWVIGGGIYLNDEQSQVEHDMLDTNAFMMMTLIVLITGGVTLLATSLYLSGKFMHQLETLAVDDPLTALHTRRYLIETAPILFSEQERRAQGHLAAIFFDIDHFKSINDRFGHACGDRVLGGIGHIIRQSVRPGDLATRYGGEEFVVLMLCREKAHAVNLAERIRELCGSQPFACGGKRVSLTISAGIAFRLDQEPLEGLLQRADEKLYQAKAQGRDRVVA